LNTVARDERACALRVPTVFSARIKTIRTENTVMDKTRTARVFIQDRRSARTVFRPRNIATLQQCGARFKSPHTKKAGPKTGFFMPEEQAYFLGASLAAPAGAAGAAAAGAGAAASFGASVAAGAGGGGGGAASGAFTGGGGGGGGASLLQPASISVASAAINTERFMF